MIERLEVDSPAYGPQAAGRRGDGKVVLVRAAVPGDVVAVRVVRETRSLVEGEIAGLIHPSPHRVQPECPAWPVCGGCSWLHMQRSVQLEYKQQLVQRAIRHVEGAAEPGVVQPIRCCPEEFGYRQRARLHFDATPGQPIRIGFFSHGSHDIVPISRCPVCVESLGRVISQWATLLPEEPFSGTAEFITDDDGRVLAALYLALPVPRPADLAGFLGTRTDLSGCLVISPRTGRGSWGMDHSVLTVMEQPHCTIPIFPAAFCQANAAINRQLVRHVVDLAQLSVQSGARKMAQSGEVQTPSPPSVLELYAGHGNFTWALHAHGFGVLAVEVGLRKELLCARQSIHDDCGIRPDSRVLFIQDNAVSFAARQARKGRAVDLVLLDPPRVGARELMPHLVALSPPAIIYVSCDPNTFGRDAAVLGHAGYRLASLTPFDMVPQTHHVELAALLVRG